VDENGRSIIARRCTFCNRLLGTIVVVTFSFHPLDVNRLSDEGEDPEFVEVQESRQRQYEETENDHGKKDPKNPRRATLRAILPSFTRMAAIVALCG